MKTVTINGLEPFLNVCSSKINRILLRIINRCFWLQKSTCQLITNRCLTSYVTFNVALNFESNLSLRLFICEQTDKGRRVLWVSGRNAEQ